MRRITVIALSLFLFGCSHFFTGKPIENSEPAVYLRSPDWQENQEKLNYEKKVYYDDGAIRELIPYKQGVRQGLAKTYYPDGTLKEEVFYVNGRLDGPARKYYENGQLWQDVNFENCLLNGWAKIYSPSGELMMEQEYLEGDLMRVRSYETEEDRQIEKMEKQEVQDKLLEERNAACARGDGQDFIQLDIPKE